MNQQIFPEYRFVRRQEKEDLLNQKGQVFWLTGLSGSGKSTIAELFERTMFSNGFITSVLDGDNIREGMNKNLGFEYGDRIENIRRVAEVAKLFVNCGIITICCFVSPTREMRNIAKEIIGQKDFREIFVDTPLEVCEKRDVKGLYSKARLGLLRGFTGIDAPYERPEAPDLILKTDEMEVAECVDELMKIFRNDRI